MYIQITSKEPEVAFENTGFEPWLVWYFQLLHSESNPLPPLIMNSNRRLIKNNRYDSRK